MSLVQIQLVPLLYETLESAMIQGFFYILVNPWLHKLKDRDKLSQKNQKISDTDFDIGMNPFIRFVLRGLQGTIYFHDPVKDENLFVSKKVLDQCGYTNQEILALDLGIRSIIHNDDLPGVYEMNEQVLKLKDGDFAEATYRAKKKEGGWAWYRSEEYVYKRDTEGNPTVIFGVAQDVTLLKEKEAQLQKLSDQNAFLLEIAQLMTVGQGDMKVTLQTLTKRLADQFQVVCSIFFHDEHDNSIQPGAIYYHDSELVDLLTELFSKTTVKVGEGMVGKVIQDGKEFVISETDDDLRRRTAAVDPRLESVGLAYLPIKGLSKIVGAISLVQLVEFKPFTKQDWEGIAQVVRNVSLYVEHSIITNERKVELDRLAKAESDLVAKERAEMTAMIKGQEIERKRVAADMHDGVGQILSAISIQLSQLLVKKQNVEKEDLSSLADKVQYGIVEVRNVSHALKPDVLENFGLVPAIVEVCNNLSTEIGPSISFNHIDVERRFEEDIEINVYRIVQELVNNCIKHAKAKDVFVTLIKDEDKLVLTVEDDGEGMADLDHTGIGLNNVKLRADIINGEMNIDSAVGKGSLINIEVPI